MRKRVWIHLIMAVMVAGLFLTVSCAKKTILPDGTTIEDQEKAQAAEAERMAKQKMDEQKIQEQAIMEAKMRAAEKRFENQDVHFEYDSSELSSMAKTVLKEKAAWLKANPGAAVTIEGHCDERGTTEYNLALGERRAAAAKSYLINLGISAGRLNTISYGEEQPVAMGTTEDAYRKNRRAHFAIN